MGNQVIYLPQKPSFGSALGQGVSGALTDYSTKAMDQMVKQQRYAGAMQLMQAIQAAPSREEALKLVAGADPSLIQDPQEMERVLQITNQFHPLRDETPTAVEGWTPEGAPTKAFVPKGKLGDLNDPTKRAGILGPNVSLSKPEERVPMYVPDEKSAIGFRSVGTHPISARQTVPALQNALTEGEMKMQKEQDAAQNAQRRTEAMDKKEAARREREDTRDQQRLDQQDMSNRMAMTRQIQSLVLDAMNVKHSIGVDGALNMDFSSDPEKAKIFYDGVIPNIDKYLDDPKMKGRPSTIVDRLLKDAKYSATVNPPQEPAKSKTEEPGAVSKVLGAAKDSIVSMFSTGKKDSGNAIPDAPVDPKQRKVGQVYNTPAAGKKKWTGTGWVNP